MNIFQKRLSKIVRIIEENNHYHIHQETRKIVGEQGITGLESLMVTLDIYDKLHISRYKIKKIILKELKETGQVSIASICKKLNIKIY